MFYVCIAHCMPEKIHKMSKCENSCLFVWSTVFFYFVIQRRMEFSTLSISRSPFILTLSFLFVVFNAAGVRAIPQDDFVEGEHTYYAILWFY